MSPTDVTVARSSLVTSSLVTATAVALAVLDGTGILGLELILAVIFLTGIASGFERPALAAFEAQISPLEQALRGVSLVSSFSQTGSILVQRWVASRWRSSASRRPTR